MKYKVGDRFEVKKGDEHEFYLEDIGKKITILETEYAKNSESNISKMLNEVESLSNVEELQDGE